MSSMPTIGLVIGVATLMVCAAPSGCEDTTRTFGGESSGGGAVGIPAGGTAGVRSLGGSGGIGTLDVRTDGGAAGGGPGTGAAAPGMSSGANDGGAGGMGTGSSRGAGAGGSGGFGVAGGRGSGGGAVDGGVGTMPGSRGGGPQNASGGRAATGGQPAATGGSSGGRVGMAASGGVGGAPSTGGRPSTGGAPATGGMPGTGGNGPIGMGTGGSPGTTVDCAQLIVEYDAEIANGRVCKTNGNAPCQVRVPKRLAGCGSACETFVDKSNGLEQIIRKWTMAGCSAPACSQVPLCVNPVAATCLTAPLSSNGMCSDLVGGGVGVGL